jgi:hypothetical protein
LPLLVLRRYPLKCPLMSRCIAVHNRSTEDIPRLLFSQARHFVALISINTKLGILHSKNILFNSLL